jgi:Fe-S-cluster containining protein
MNFASCPLYWTETEERLPATRKTKQSSVHRNGSGNGFDPSGFVALSMLTSPLENIKPKPKDGPPCHVCTARCCKYFALSIDKPRSKEDFDHIRWYLMHEGIAVWVEDGDWYLEVRTVCRHLQPDNSCGIYETRPQVCRDYGSPEHGVCEYFTDDLSYDLYFESDTQLEVWLEQRKERRKRKKHAKRLAKAK